ncbi:ATP-binding cassette domain-containing protein [Desulfobotulus sp. H1]|uniref:ATP-binding cassette domain-containing protein n=1 Tax=Desulfobotulus pelophilus TaxID=2823377 RepID=A0ABT3NAZ3_9BACT|nr:ATP-binding cassette domain-containing protein [Desulfobotulus pelophilus]MCW7754336.1 ATP-binding cassette domain-containing protein [Desulfobotulus pelophilus]
MLKLLNVTKTLQKKNVLGNVTFSIKAGEMVCLTGPSGIGKTTLLEIAAGIIQPDSGIRELHAQRPACLLQDTPLLPWCSALGNMEYQLSGYFSAPARKEKALFWLERMELQGATHQKPSEMSGGMKRRLAFACCMALEPDMLFLDEPFAFLDAPWQAEFIRLLIRLNKEYHTAILMASHETAPLNNESIRIVPLLSSPVQLTSKAENASLRDVPGLPP